MKVATWNVNGIRARGEQFEQWLAAAQPDVVCLQEIKAKIEQVPAALCNIGGYWCYWHGHGGWSGVALRLRREAFAEEPVFSHPGFGHETRSVQAEAGRTIFAWVYVPNGGKGYGAKIAFVKAVIECAGDV